MTTSTTRQIVNTKAPRQTSAMNQSFLREAFGDRELGKTRGATSIARELPSTVVHDDKSVIRNANNVLAPAGIHVRHLDRHLDRESNRGIAIRIIAETSEVLVNL